MNQIYQQQLNGKVALVTGGGTGIGKSITETFVSRGAKVVITGRREAPLKELKTLYPKQVDYIQADVARSGDAKKAVNFAVEQFGQLDVLVNNAGALLMAPTVEASDEDTAHVFAVNVLGVLSFVREAIPYLTQTKGNIINISSLAATGVMPGAAAYSGSKAAVDQISRILATELGPAGIRVNVVSPGVTRTDMAASVVEHDEILQGMIAQTPLRRVGEPIDIARVVAFVASDEAGWVTGQIIGASGGIFL